MCAYTQKGEPFSGKSWACLPFCGPVSFLGTDYLKWVTVEAIVHPFGGPASWPPGKALASSIRMDLYLLCDEGQRADGGRNERLEADTLVLEFTSLGPMEC